MEDKKLDDAMIRIFSKSEALPEYDSDLEASVMHAIDHQVDHSVILALEKRRARIGFYVSTFLFICLAGVLIIQGLETTPLQESGILRLTLFMSVFALIGLLALFVQINFGRKIVFETSRNSSEQ